MKKNVQIEEFYSKIRETGVEQIETRCRQIHSEFVGAMILGGIPNLVTRRRPPEEITSGSNDVLLNRTEA